MNSSIAGGGLAANRPATTARNRSSRPSPTFHNVLSSTPLKAFLRDATLLILDRIFLEIFALMDEAQSVAENSDRGGGEEFAGGARRDERLSAVTSAKVEAG
jgi:hypothetical protein